MNCPTCGAENDVDARFCAECGTPLENQDIEATIAGQIIDVADNDVTILSTRADLLGQSETEEAEFVFDSELTAMDRTVVANEPFEPEPPEAEPPGDADDQSLLEAAQGALAPEVDDSSAPAAAAPGGPNRRLLIIGGVVVLLLLLLCCCCSIAIGAWIGADPSLLNG